MGDEDHNEVKPLAEQVSQYQWLGHAWQGPPGGIKAWVALCEQMERDRAAGWPGWQWYGGKAAVSDERRRIDV